MRYAERQWKDRDGMNGSLQDTEHDVDPRQRGRESAALIASRALKSAAVALESILNTGRMFRSFCALTMCDCASKRCIGRQV